jgi:hypothetical protein
MVVVPAIRLALAVMPLKRVHAYLRRASVRSATSHRPPVRDLEWAVQAVGRRVPGATCLTQALALELLLMRSGYDARMEIGVARVNGHFEAHAWVETEAGVRLLEGTEPTRFKKLPSGWQSS